MFDFYVIMIKVKTIFMIRRLWFVGNVKNLYIVSIYKLNPLKIFICNKIWSY